MDPVRLNALASRFSRVVIQFNVGLFSLSIEREVVDDRYSKLVMNVIDYASDVDAWRPYYPLRLKRRLCIFIGYSLRRQEETP